jgi:hypothetical protein
MASHLSFGKLLAQGRFPAFVVEKRGDVHKGFLCNVLRKRAQRPAAFFSGLMGM